MKLILFTCLALLQAPVVKPAPSSAPGVTVTVRAQSEVSGATLTLGDISAITGPDKTLASRIAAIEVGAAPLIGLSRTLLKADIVTRLRFNHVEMDRVEIVSAPTFRVSRVGTEIAVPEVVEFAANALKAARKENNEGTQIEALPVPYKWIVPPGKREMRAGAIRGQDSTLAIVPVTLLVGGQPVKTVEVSFRIKQLVPVLVATRQLEAHTILKPEDVSVTMREVAQASVTLSDAALVIGLRTTRQIPDGAVLTKGSVEAAPVVTIGAAVEVQVLVGGISVSTTGVARSQGAVGDRVRVFVTKTNKEISATVVDAKTVRVEENG